MDEEGIAELFMDDSVLADVASERVSDNSYYLMRLGLDFSMMAFFYDAIATYLSAVRVNFDVNMTRSKYIIILLVRMYDVRDLITRKYLVRSMT